MKTRIISAAIALAIFIPLIVVGGIYFAVAASILSILAYKEIIDLKKSHKKIPKVVSILGLVSLLLVVLGNYENPSNIYFIDRALLFIPIIALLLPVVFYKSENYSTKDAFYMIASVLLIGCFFNSLIALRNLPGENTGLFLFIYLFSITLLTDTFAYFVGILIGKHKMAPTVSPKKSWEGFFAGLIGGSTCALIVYSNLLGSLSFKIILMTILLSVIGQLGDLVFSKIKRENDIKDFSNIMPGHGGVLDRLDSIIMVVISYIIIMNIF